MATNWRKIKAMEKRNKERILAVCPTVTEESGVYILTREEGGFRYAYIGQAKHLLSRLAQHLSGYQWIDISIKKHKLYGEKNPNGWNIDFIAVAADKLDDTERELISEYANNGYQMRNVTSGGQNGGKSDIRERKPSKTYREGVAHGKRLVTKEIGDLFGKHLKAVTTAEKPSKHALNALKKFYEIIGEEKE